MAQVQRWFLGEFNGNSKCTFNWAAIQHGSVVLISVSQGDQGDSTASPARFVGDASIRVENISPIDKAVVFRVIVDWFEPLALWTDIFVADELPQGFAGRGIPER
jgi:hypothetical protein